MSDKLKKPSDKPTDARFSSGPCKKHPGWSLDKLNIDCLGRKHRAEIPRLNLHSAIIRSAKLLGLPTDWQLVITPASDTGAFELAMWCMLGQRPVDVLVWESFSAAWANDIQQQLQLQEVHCYRADYGQLPDLYKVNPKHDCVFVFNGTSSGTCVPHLDWLADNREGMVLCDATSAVFAVPINYQKLDVVTWSWQKCLGGEAGFGMLALSPRALKHLANYQPKHPIPRIFQIKKSGKIDDSLFTGTTLNTPSMLAVADLHSALDWAEKIGGLTKLIERSQNNFEVMDRWVTKSKWADWLPTNPNTRSTTSMCFNITTNAYTKLTESNQRHVIEQISKWLAEEAIAYDISGYRYAPPHLRIWGGPTIDSGDLVKLLPWLDWAYHRWESAQKIKY